MTKTGELGLMAIATIKGMFLVNSLDKKSLSVVSEHLKDSNLNVISYVKENTVILGVFNTTEIIVFDYS